MPSADFRISNDPGFQIEVIVEVLRTAITSMMKLGLSHEEALNGILSQVAVQVDKDAMEYALKLNQQLHDIYESLPPELS
tara:strand:+ start:66 stop:305 length:240 start_codon:yes stop_codon:yes gene_type:complete